MQTISFFTPNCIDFTLEEWNKRQRKEDEQ